MKHKYADHRAAIKKSQSAIPGRNEIIEECIKWVEGRKAGRDASQEVWREIAKISRGLESLKNAAPQAPQQEASSGVVESSTDDRPKARDESGPDTGPAGAAPFTERRVAAGCTDAP